MADDTADAAARPNRRKVREGIVVSDSMDATVVVAVVERVRHPRYGKTVQRTKRGSSRPARCPSSSAGGWPKSPSVHDDPARVPPPSG